MHDPAVALGEYCPALHAVQPEDPRDEKCPLPQLAHDPAAAAALCFPASHGEQLLGCFALTLPAENCPAPQSVQSPPGGMPPLFL
jgi:hypothetical protein